ncbi:MAG: hypothetical protein WDM94_10110 [Bauldia sp.]
MDRRYPLVSLAVVAGAALFIGHTAMYVLPPTLAGLPTPVLLILGMAGSVAAAVRFL